MKCPICGTENPDSMAQCLCGADLVVESIRKKMNLKSNDELLKIWKENDRRHYTEEAFKIIKQLILQRGIALPQQIEKIDEVASLKKITIRPSSSEKFLGFFLLFTAIATLLVFWTFLIVLEKAGNPLEENVIELIILIITFFIFACLSERNLSRIKKVSMYEILEKLKSTNISDNRYAIKRLFRYKSKIDDPNVLYSLISLLGSENKWVTENCLKLLYSNTGQTSLRTKGQWLNWYFKK